jgi:methyltransferase (TIGR00027 family)
MGDASTAAKRSKRSHTAEGAAAVRALAHREPDPELRNPDYLAQRFLGLVLWLRSSFRPLRPVTLWAVERLVPGFYRFVIARTKLFDSVLLAELQNGVSQVVILGAGADSRSYRFEAELAGATVFEVDHPLTSAWKQRRVRQLFGALPAKVTYVGVDFDHESLAGALDTAGVRRDLRTLFLWEGVTPYLTAEAVDTTLSTVATFASGSSVVFDYFFAEAFTDPAQFPTATKYFTYTAKHGEPLTFGLPMHHVPEFLAARGLTLVHDARAAELSARFAQGDPRMLTFSPIAHARVP